MFPPFLRSVLIFGICVACADLAAGTESSWSVRMWHGNGLTGKRIVGVAQTSDGYMWAATPTGLARLDPQESEVLSLEQLVGQPVKVHSMVRAGAGELWLG